MTSGRREFPIIDAHIHLFPESENDSISWITSDNPLRGQRSVDQYREATGGAASISGFVVVENDRTHDLRSGKLDGSGWKGPLQEVSWLRRIALGDPKPGEGHAAGDAQLCMGLIPWAPVPSGPVVLERYLERAREVSGPAWPKIKGFRYLLQDKHQGTALKREFVESLKLLGRKGLLFEVCIDHHRGGKCQLEDAVAMARMAREGVETSDQITLVIDHFLKPDMAVPIQPSDPSFNDWSAAIATLGAAPQAYIKLSGGLSEISDALKEKGPARIAELIQPWFTKILESFGPDRILFGSDWPVCTIGMDDAWGLWREVVVNLCSAAGLNQREVARIFAGTAEEVYGS